jgi:opacity protein-like surface antigen
MFRRLSLALLGVALAAGGARAQSLADYDYEDLTFRGMSLDYGYLWPNKVEPTSRYGVRFDLGYLGPGVRITPSLTYWSSRMRTTELSRLATRLSRLPALQNQAVLIRAEDLGEIRWSDFAANLDGHFAWNTDIGLMTYLGAGVGIHKLNGSGASIEGTFIEDLLDAVTAGATALGGLEYEPVSRLRIYAEASYTVMSYLHYPALKVGAAFLLTPERVVRGRRPQNTQRTIRPPYGWRCWGRGRSRRWCTCRS